MSDMRGEVCPRCEHSMSHHGGGSGCYLIVDRHTDEECPCMFGTDPAVTALSDLVRIMQESWLAEREQTGACYTRIGNALDDAGLLPS